MFGCGVPAVSSARTVIPMGIERIIGGSSFASELYLAENYLLGRKLRCWDFIAVTRHRRCAVAAAT